MRRTPTRRWTPAKMVTAPLVLIAEAIHILALLAIIAFVLVATGLVRLLCWGKS